MAVGRAGVGGFGGSERSGDRESTGDGANVACREGGERVRSIGVCRINFFQVSFYIFFSAPAFPGRLKPRFRLFFARGKNNCGKNIFLPQSPPPLSLTVEAFPTRPRPSGAGGGDREAASAPLSPAYSACST